MSNTRKFKRHFDEKRVWIANEVEKKKIEIARKFVEERAAKDAEFAKDVLKAVGETLPEEIRKVAEETIARETEKKEFVEALQKDSLDKKIEIEAIDILKNS